MVRASVPVKPHGRGAKEPVKSDSTAEEEEEATGFFEWWTDLTYRVRTQPGTAFKVGLVVGLLISAAIGAYLAVQNPPGLGPYIGWLVGGAILTTLLIAGLMALNARMLQAQVKTYRSRLNLSETDATREALADARQRETHWSHVLRHH
jgi:uncharacterized membrane protein YciS (DUF1049 family)